MSMVSIIHFSDLHVHAATDKCLIRLNGIAEVVIGELQSSEIVFILVSGDVAFSGNKKEYDAACEKFRQFENKLRDGGVTTIKWLITPGNHDGEFKTSCRARQFSIDGILKQNEEAIDESVIDICTAPQSNYYLFKEQLRGNGNSNFFRQAP